MLFNASFRADFRPPSVGDFEFAVRCFRSGVTPNIIVINVTNSITQTYMIVGCRNVGA